MQPTLTSIRSRFRVTRWRDAVMRVVRGCIGGGAWGPSGDELQRLLDCLLAEAREAGSEAGAWDLPDAFLESVEPRLRALLRRRPEALELDPAVLAVQIGALTQECQRLDAAGSMEPGPGAPGLAIGRAGAVGLLACAVVTVVGLQLQGVPLASAALVGSAGFVGGVAAVEVLPRWARGRPRRQRAQQLRRLRAELARLEAEQRRTARARAQVDQWVATSRQLVEAEYQRYRARAARAMGPPRLAAAPGPRALPELPDASGRALSMSRVGN